MNERIKELAIEANMIAPEPNGFDRTSLSKSQQKFAELIVRECARLADNSPQYIDGREILEHFGVDV